ncbi:YjjG family noncanonical pyrimidine nucleotidase [Riemerella anatipestifer]|nr:YjjG family noncanonical pyrimidine nucleotidase [Riemerella anatipestifer]MDY3532893.1 YjjG family noncanonical pyrimidine nucleotidase [Riemerella anatipestifer]MDY3534552.1 YjjG family noncanonical pyrimidine nucleotidase [Riemerella anatipestifer]
MKIRHIFFDLDNTLWDHRKNARLTLQNLFNKYSIEDKIRVDFETFHEVYHTINEELWAKIRDGVIDKETLRKHRFYDVFLHFGLDDFELSQTFENLFLDEIIEYNELVEGSISILDYLKDKGYTLHILSNGFQEVTHRKLEGSGIAHYFDTVTSADEIGLRKPHPEIFQLALDKAKATVEESYFIGDDWIADALGARDFGLKVLFFDVFNEGFEEQGVINIKSLAEVERYL